MSVRSLLPLQFSIRAIVLITAAVAFLTWNYVRFGSLPLFGLAIAVPGGLIVGVLIGLCHCAVRRGAVGGIWGALASVAVSVIWWQVQIVLHREVEHYRAAPFRAFLHPEIVMSLCIAAVFGAVPIIAISAVHDRGGTEVALRSTLTCGVAASTAGLSFFAFDVWSRGGMPTGLPLPYPIAIMIPLCSGTIAAALTGLITSLGWLAIRSALR